LDKSKIIEITWRQSKMKADKVLNSKVLFNAQENLRQAHIRGKGNRRNEKGTAYLACKTPSIVTLSCKN